VAASELDDDTRDDLVEAAHDPPSLEGIEGRITHPILRELLLALSWELAAADGRIDTRERDFHAELARRLDISPERAQAIRVSITDRLD
jgi:hypothetical protein